MCLWLLTACFGLLPTNPSPIVIVPGVPAPIIVPTTAATTAATTATTATMGPMPPGPGNVTMRPTMPPTMQPTMAPTMPPTMAPTMPPTMAPTMPPTMAPTMPPTVAPTMPPTMPPTMMPNATGAPPSPPPTVAPTTGPLPIDPRLGTTPGPLAALQVQPVGYSSQIPSYDATVRFPRQKRNVEPLNINIILKNSSNSGEHHVIIKRQSSNCRCVPAGTCIRVPMIDVRIVTPVTVQCPAGQEYCCGNTTTPTNVTQIACGTLQTVPTTGVTPMTGQANLGEFPWQALILTKQNDYIGGGVLIDRVNVLTVTHRILPYVVSGAAPNVKVRLGDWDAAGTYEPVAHQEYTIQRVTSHPSYNANTLQFDITVLRLASPVPFTPTAGAAPTINRACLPSAPNATFTGQRCMVSGWGKDAFGAQGQFQNILKKVDVPIVAPNVCQTQLRTARLGPTYVLDTTSFVCAGGELNKDACTGDGGSGLVCPVNGRWTVVGLVAWGLGCANANVSAVYVNVAAFLPWIQQQVSAT